MHSRKAIAAAIPPEAITPAVTAPVVMEEAVPAPADPDLEVMVLAVTLVQVEPTAVARQAAGTRAAAVAEPLEARQPAAVERAPTAEPLMLEMVSAAAVAMAARWRWRWRDLWRRGRRQWRQQQRRASSGGVLERRKRLRHRRIFVDGRWSEHLVRWQWWICGERSQLGRQRRS